MPLLFGSIHNLFRKTWGIVICYCCVVFESPKLIDNISISAKIGVTYGAPEFGTQS